MAYVMSMWKRTTIRRLQHGLLGAVLVDESLDRSFYARLKPDLAEMGSGGPCRQRILAEETLTFAEPVEAMQNFERWLLSTQDAVHSHQRQQRLRLAIHQLVFLAFHGPKSVRAFEHEPRIALQGHGQDTLQNFKH